MLSKGLMALLAASPPPLRCLGTLVGAGGTTFQIRTPAKMNDQCQKGSGSGTVGRAGRCARQAVTFAAECGLGL